MSSICKGPESEEGTAYLITEEGGIFSSLPGMGRPGEMGVVSVVLAGARQSWAFKPSKNPWSLLNSQQAENDASW